MTTRMKEFTDQAAIMTVYNSLMSRALRTYGDNVNAICAARLATMLIIDAINSAHY